MFSGNRVYAEYNKVRRIYGTKKKTGQETCRGGKKSKYDGADPEGSRHDR